MYLRRGLNEALPYQGHFFNAHKPLYRFTPAGPDHAQIAAVNGVMDYMDTLYAHHVPETPATPVERAAVVRELMRDQETRLLQPLLDFLAGHPAVGLIGSTRAERRAPTVAFSVRDRSPDAIARALAQAGLGVGAGDFYAYRLVEALGLHDAGGVVRASFVHYTAPEEVDRLIAALDALLR